MLCALSFKLCALRFLSRAFCFKSEIFLGHIAEGNYNRGSNDFGNRGIQMKMLYKKSYKNIIQHNTNNDQ